MSTVMDVWLVPLAELDEASLLEYRLADQCGQASRGQLLREANGAPWRLHLHEHDSLALEIAMPPLAGKRLTSAVCCAVQALVLGDAGQVHVAHGARRADGQVAVAWLGLTELARLQAWLQADGIRPAGLYARQDDALSAADLCGGLAGPAKPMAWGRTLGIWSAATLVWCLGLNLYAAHLAREGEELRTQMVTQVRMAFPQLPVVLNPLQQARQQLQGGQGGAAPGLAALLEGAGQVMPFLAGNVEAMDYQDGQLRITALADGGKVSTGSAWQAELAARGIDGQASGQGWTLRATKPSGEELAHAD
ncbi:type II secretion system protein GspL [Pseudomonas carassii]|uniref:Type II secretion system protein GspL n=1 Tax=Pseudomonas carassii TaxID=3115855 RepID=A0ABU7H7F8_9PSED|nr:type II secretion system protein GspL [Pseudomonas sp. 137P]MEE1887255.1 type II secretion system protein GspL [Pseudomonas sp. 137P]